MGSISTKVNVQVTLSIPVRNWRSKDTIEQSMDRSTMEAICRVNSFCTRDNGIDLVGDPVIIACIGIGSV